MSEETKAKSRAAAITIINEVIEAEEKKFNDFKRNKLRGIQNLVEVGQVWSPKPHSGIYFEVTVVKFLVEGDPYFNVLSGPLISFSFVSNGKLVTDSVPIGTLYLAENFILKA